MERWLVVAGFSLDSRRACLGSFREMKGGAANATEEGQPGTANRARLCQKRLRIFGSWWQTIASEDTPINVRRREDLRPQIDLFA